MARALPFHVRQLFALLQRLGWSQTRCATALGLTPQAVNNWASGGLNVPAKYRGALASLVTLAIHHALAAAAPEDRVALTQTIDRTVTEWFLANQDARGVHDRWHSEMGQKLRLTFKTPLSAQGVEDWQAALVLHLEAAHVLRGLIQRHELAPPMVETPFRPPEETPGGWCWFLANDLAGERLEKSADLAAWEAAQFQDWLASEPPDTQAELAAMRAAGAKKRPHK